MRSFVIFLLLCTALASSAQTDESIYADALENGWQNYSWATVDFASASPNPVHSDTKAISVSVKAGYQALYLHHAALNSTIYSNLTFWIHGGTSGGQLLNVQATLDGKAQAAVALPRLIAGWQAISISLGQLGVARKPNFDGLWIQDRSGTALAPFYVDDIRLTVASAPAVVHLTIAPEQLVQTLDNRYFGLNTAIWDSAFDTTATLTLLSDAGVGFLRFPGGSASDDYHWASNRSSSNTWTWATSFPKFAQIATNLHSSVVITVNYGSGSPQEAAAWVRNANITNHVGVRFWEIGNENYGTWETDTNARPHDPFTYATRVQEYWTQMKAADPSIKIGVVAITGEDAYSNGYTDHPARNPRTGAMHNGWTPVMLNTLKQLGVTPDFLIYHRYAQGPGEENDQNLLQSSATWTRDAADLRTQLNDYLGSAGAPVELLCTENNSVYADPGKQSTSLVNGLFLADSVCQALQTEFKGVVWWDLRNGQDATRNNSASLYGWRMYGDYGIISEANDRYPTYFATKMLQHFARGGDRIVAATTDYPFLSVYAAMRTNGSLALLVINKSSSQILSGDLALGSYGHSDVVTVYSYGRPQDEAARLGTTAVDISTNQISLSGSFRYSFQPYSLSVFAVPPSAPRLETMSNVPSGFRISLACQAGTYALEASSDLTEWTRVATNVVSGPGATTNAWTDTESMNLFDRFYRAVWLP